jgi:hypothetical protein
VGIIDDNDGAMPGDPLVFKPVAFVVPLLVKRLFKKPVYERPDEFMCSSVCRIVNGSSKHSISGLYNLVDEQQPDELQRMTRPFFRLLGLDFLRRR